MTGGGVCVFEVMAIDVALCHFASSALTEVQLWIMEYGSRPIGHGGLVQKNGMLFSAPGL